MRYRLMDDPALNTLNTSAYRTVIGTRAAGYALALVGIMWTREIFLEHHDAAERILDAALLFIASLSGLNVAQYGIKRFSDRETVQARAAGHAQGTAAGAAAAAVVAAATRPLTAEHPAMQVNAQQATIKQAVAPDPAEPASAKSPAEPDLYTDDERGD